MVRDDTMKEHGGFRKRGVINPFAHVFAPFGGSLIGDKQSPLYIIPEII